MDCLDLYMEVVRNSWNTCTYIHRHVLFGMDNKNDVRFGDLAKSKHIATQVYHVLSQHKGKSDNHFDIRTYLEKL